MQRDVLGDERGDLLVRGRGLSVRLRLPEALEAEERAVSRARHRLVARHKPAAHSARRVELRGARAAQNGPHAVEHLAARRDRRHALDAQRATRLHVFDAETLFDFHQEPQVDGSQ
ncbi:MAG: hypothetical protein DMF65_05730 [Acidobacteria bacterium]|nr:MAG: hypothetical protein DMF65_05730 [Acidobacteriota bacterium]